MTIKRLDYEIIKPNDYNPKYAFDPEEVRQLEQDYKEVVETLNRLINSNIHFAVYEYCSTLKIETDIFSKEIKLIEKAYNMKWEDIKWKDIKQEL